MQLKRRYLWNVDYSPDKEPSESLLNLYIERVLQRGTIEDLREIGLDRIRRALPRLNLPYEIRDFWEWYFARHPEIGSAGEDPHAAPGSAPP